MLVQQRERLLASVAGSSAPPVLNFVVNFDSGKLLDTEIFEQERWSSAEKVIGTLTLAVEEASSTSEVVYSVVTKKQRLFFLEGSDGFFFSFGRI